MLNGIIHQLKLSEIILSVGNYKPFPAANDRNAWEGLPASTRDRWIREAANCAGFAWPSLPAVRYMDYVRNGDRTRYQNVYYQRRQALATLVIGECMENKGRFLDDIINGIWCICEETIWVVPAHMSLSTKSHGDALPDVTDQVIDLFSAETGALLAWTDYLLKPQLDRASRNLCKRIQHEIKRRILDPYLERDDFWWLGLQGKRRVNNWNPWINSNCLAAFLLMEQDAERRVMAVRKVLRSLDQFIGIHFSDGGCDEGPGYWGHAGGSLFDCLELLYGATDGRINLYGEPLIQEIGRYIYRAHICSDYFVNFADGSARLNIEANLVYRFGRRIHDEKLAALGAASYRPSGGSRMMSLFRTLPAIFDEEKLSTGSASSPLIRDVWMDGIQVMTAREREGSAEGLFLAAKGGNNAESHNHNDIGQFIVYCNGKPFLIDAGVGEYTSKTFGSQRYDIWTMQSSYHNLPTIDGVQQKNGGEYRATEVDYTQEESFARLSLNLAAAYPPEAGLASWHRECRLNRGGPASVEIIDRFLLEQPTDDIRLSFLTGCRVELREPGAIFLQSEDGQTLSLKYDGERLEPSLERIPLEDDKLRRVWGPELTRIVLTAKGALSDAVWITNIAAL